jgi:hypothetical protein
MTPFGQMRPGTTARALVAALGIAAALVSLTTGPTAYAARGRSTDDGGPGAGGRPGHTTTAVSRDPINDYPKCTVIRPDGTIDFYLPLETVTIEGTELVCGTDGKWFPLGPPRPTPGVRVQGGGVYAP